MKGIFPQSHIARWSRGHTISTRSVPNKLDRMVVYSKEPQTLHVLHMSYMSFCSLGQVRSLEK